MEELTKMLGPDESLLWSGKPNNVTALDAEYKPSITKKIIITLIAYVAILLLFIIRNNFKIGIAAILTIIAFMIIGKPFFQANFFNEEYWYGITNKRILLYTNDGQSIEYSKIKQAQIVTDKAGQSSLLINGAIEESKKDKIRAIAERCSSRSGEEFEASVALYAIPDAKAVKELLQNYISL